MYSTGSIWIIDLCGGWSHAAALYEKHEQLEMESSPCTAGLEALEGTKGTQVFLFCDEQNPQGR